MTATPVSFLARLRHWLVVRGRQVWRVTVAVAHGARDAVALFVTSVRARHDRQVATDPSYPVALAAGGRALAGVLTASPALAAALAVFLTGILGAERRRYPPTRETTSWDREGWDPDRHGARLWDRDDWDE